VSRNYLERGRVMKRTPQIYYLTIILFLLISAIPLPARCKAVDIKEPIVITPMQIAFPSNVPTIEPTPTNIPTSIPEPSITPEPVKTDKEVYNGYAEKICRKYRNVDPIIVKCIIFYESTYDPKATNGNCVGLMQVSKHWHADRAKKLGITNFYDPYSNILLGVDYLSELFKDYKDPKLVLMLYNMKRSTAFGRYKTGSISTYACSILNRSEKIKKGGLDPNGN
jgi:hypothetical protein